MSRGGAASTLGAGKWCTDSHHLKSLRQQKIAWRESAGRAELSAEKRTEHWERKTKVTHLPTPLFTVSLRRRLRMAISHYVVKRRSVGAIMLSLAFAAETRYVTTMRHVTWSTVSPRTTVLLPQSKRSLVSFLPRPPTMVTPLPTPPPPSPLTSGFPAAPPGRPRPVTSPLAAPFVRLFRPGPTGMPDRCSSWWNAARPYTSSSVLSSSKLSEEAGAWGSSPPGFLTSLVGLYSSLPLRPVWLSPSASRPPSTRENVRAVRFPSQVLSENLA